MEEEIKMILRKNRLTPGPFLAETVGTYLFHEVNAGKSEILCPRLHYS